MKQNLETGRKKEPLTRILSYANNKKAQCQKSENPSEIDENGPIDFRFVDTPSAGKDASQRIDGVRCR